MKRAVSPSRSSSVGAHTRTNNTKKSSRMTEPHAGGKKEVSEAPQQPQLCVKCYEFFGNPANMNMCSSCFRTHEKATAGPTLMDVEPSPAKTIPSVLSVAPHEGGAACVPCDAEATTARAAIDRATTQEKAAVAAPAVVVSPAPAPSEPTPMATGPDPVTTSGQRPPQKHKNRCFTCNKKIGLTGFTCRCGYIFCSEHRYSDKHECTFDYKLAGREGIAKANPKVVASKINKI